MIDEKKLKKQLAELSLKCPYSVLDERFSLYTECFEKAICLLKEQPKVGEWIPFKLDEDGILEFPLPEEDQEILISDGYDVWMDTFLKDGEDCYLDSNIELIGLYWMPLPEPYKKDV